MTSVPHRILRRIRYGRPIIVVSGLPRSGTSLAMQMLEAGGVRLLTDRTRPPDANNPRGYHEYEPVKHLHTGTGHAWLADARGKAVKIVSFLLTYLPETYDYRVIFMQRDLDEVIASEAQMLAAGGQPPEPGSQVASRAAYEEHLRKVARFVERRECFLKLEVGYRGVLQRPEAEARRIAEFLGGGLNVAAMAGAVDPALYRNRR